jgi:hypothetical protein
VTMSDIADLLKQEREEHHWGVEKALPNDKGKIITFPIIVPILGAISSKKSATSVTSLCLYQEVIVDFSYILMIAMEASTT